MKSHVVKLIVLVVVFAAAVGVVVMLLWNWLLPPIFGIKAINCCRPLELYALPVCCSVVGEANT